MNKKLLIVILLLAIVLRFYKLASFPVSLYWDEAAIGYDAFSIAKTGHDQYGKKFPLLFQSFNLNSNGKFTILKTIYDYSGKAEVFKIGQWL